MNKAEVFVAQFKKGLQSIPGAQLDAAKIHAFAKQSNIEGQYIKYDEKTGEVSANVQGETHTEKIVNLNEAGAITGLVQPEPPAAQAAASTEGNNESTGDTTSEGGTTTEAGTADTPNQGEGATGEADTATTTEAGNNEAASTEGNNNGTTEAGTTDETQAATSEAGTTNATVEGTGADATQGGTVTTDGGNNSQPEVKGEGEE